MSPAALNHRDAEPQRFTEKEENADERG